MSSGGPTREQADLAEVLEMVLDKGIVINADVAITVGETELLGIELRAAIASFETAAKYGLAFPSGTDMRRVEQASGRQSLEDEDITPIDLGIEASSGGSAAEDEDEDSEGSSSAAPGRRPTPTVMAGSVGDEVDETDEGAGGDEAEHESDADGGDAADDDIDDAEVEGDDAEADADDVEADADDAGTEDDDADADDQDADADDQDADGGDA